MRWGSALGGSAVWDASSKACVNTVQATTIATCAGRPLEHMDPERLQRARQDLYVPGDLAFGANLAGDIDRLHGIIGDGDNKAYNPLDRRKP